MEDDETRKMRMRKGDRGETVMGMGMGCDWVRGQLTGPVVVVRWSRRGELVAS
jgi:hypothetical protein